MASPPPSTHRKNSQENVTPSRPEKKLDVTPKKDTTASPVFSGRRSNLQGAGQSGTMNNLTSPSGKGEQEQRNALTRTKATRNKNAPVSPRGERRPSPQAAVSEGWLARLTDTPANMYEMGFPDKHSTAKEPKIPPVGEKKEFSEQSYREGFGARVTFDSDAVEFRDRPPRAKEPKVPPVKKSVERKSKTATHEILKEQSAYLKEKKITNIIENYKSSKPMDPDLEIKAYILDYILTHSLLDHDIRRIHILLAFLQGDKCELTKFKTSLPPSMRGVPFQPRPEAGPLTLTLSKEVKFSPLEKEKVTALLDFLKKEGNIDCEILDEKGNLLIGPTEK